MICETQVARISLPPWPNWNLWWWPWWSWSTQIQYLCCVSLVGGKEGSFGQRPYIDSVFTMIENTLSDGMLVMFCITF